MMCSKVRCSETFHNHVFDVLVQCGQYDEKVKYSIRQNTRTVARGWKLLIMSNNYYE